VSFSVSAAPGQRFEATVTRVFPAMDTLTRTVEVHARVRDGKGILKPEMFAEAEMSGADAGRVLTVPSGAIQSFEGDTVVIAGDKQGDGMQLAAIPVRVGRRTWALAEIVSGIDSGRTVVVTGAAVAKAEILKRRGGG
jgi:multidrug efflux pump subunit AcrA (membrane-fusion protein)